MNFFSLLCTFTYFHLYKAKNISFFFLKKERKKKDRERTLGKPARRPAPIIFLDFFEFHELCFFVSVNLNHYFLSFEIHFIDLIVYIKFNFMDL